MNYMKKTLFAVVAVLVIAAGFWLYWEREIPLKEQLPKVNWHDITLVGIVLEGHVLYSVDNEALREINEALSSAVVNRRPEREDAKGDGFWIVLCTEDDHAQLSIIVKEDGRINIGDRCFEGGEELYCKIQKIASGLPSELSGHDHG